MKYLIPIIILGISEVVLIGQLHSIFGLSKLVTIFIVTTLFGALVAWFNYGAFREHKQNSNLGKNFHKRIKEKRVSETDKNKMISLGYFAIYIIGCTLIAIPGLITDIIGFLLLLPPVTTFIAEKYGETGFGLYTTNQ